MDNNFKVVLESVDSKMSALQVLVKISGVTEDDAMMILSSMPSTVKENISSNEAGFIVELLSEAGCKASVVSDVVITDVENEVPEVVESKEEESIDEESSNEDFHTLSRIYRRANLFLSYANKLLWVSIALSVIGALTFELGMLLSGVVFLVVSFFLFRKGKNLKKSADASMK